MFVNGPGGKAPCGDNCMDKLYQQLYCLLSVVKLVSQIGAVDPFSINYSCSLFVQPTTREIGERSREHQHLLVEMLFVLFISTSVMTLAFGLTTKYAWSMRISIPTYGNPSFLGLLDHLSSSPLRSSHFHPALYDCNDIVLLLCLFINNDFTI